MDHNFDIVSQGDVKGLLEKCIIATNNTVHKWKSVNKVKSHEIQSVEVKSILLGFIRKYLVKDQQDFKRFKGIINIATDYGNKYVTNIMINSSQEKYFKKKYIIEEMEKVSTKIDYYSTHPKDDDIQEERKTKDGELINFSRIENVLF